MSAAGSLLIMLASLFLKETASVRKKASELRTAMAD
jgi:hypothetical protein